MNHPEKVHFAEISPARAEPLIGEAKPVGITAAERLWQERSAMLTAVERYIPVRLREKLRAKIALERDRLARLLTSAIKPAARPVAVLTPAFFELKDLEINLFE